MDQRTTAVVLYGGWLLLFNPPPQPQNAPLSAWKKIGEHDTAYLCDQKRHTEAAAAFAKQAKEKPAGHRLTTGELELRYRCERAEHVSPPRER
jgi:hypothetical protein